MCTRQESKDMAESFLDPLIKSKVVNKLGDVSERKDSLKSRDIEPNKITQLQAMKCNLRCKHCVVGCKVLRNGFLKNQASSY